jgi:peptide/nickel transport system substrate-binding protein
MRKITVALSLFFAVFLYFGTTDLPAIAGQSDKVLKAAFESEVRSLDPHIGRTTEERFILVMLANGLFKFKPGEYKIEGLDLAEKYDVSEDGMVWTFNLKKGVMFHPFPGYPNGLELTAEDVVYSINRAGNPQSSAFASDMKAFSPEALDRYTVKITLKHRLPPGQLERTLSNYGGGFVVSKKAVEKLGRDFATHPIGTGPFKLEKYDPGVKVVLSANKDYFNGKPRLEGVEVIFMPDLSSREAAIRAGEVDMILGFREQSWVEKAAKWKNKNIVPVTHGPGAVYTLHFDVTKPPFDNIKIRQAFAYAINRDEVVAFMGKAMVDPEYAAIPHELPGSLSKEEVESAGLLYQFDLEEAKKLLAEAGHETLDVKMFISQKAQYSRALENIQAQLMKAGINLQLNVVDHSTYHSYIRKDLNPIVVYAAARPTPDTWFSQFYHSSSIVVKGKAPVTNFSHCDSIDDLIEKARSSENLANASKYWKEAQIKILEELCAYSLYGQKYAFAVNKGLSWGYDLKASHASAPQINENTDINRQ